MSSGAAAALRLVLPKEASSHAPERVPQRQGPPRLEDLFVPGSLVEVRAREDGDGRASIALMRCAAALAAGDEAVWVNPPPDLFLLPAFEACRELSRLLVVQVPDGKAALRAADLVLSCTGAARVVVVGLPAGANPSEAQLVRLQRRAEKGGVTVILLDGRRPTEPPLGAVVSCRLGVGRARSAAGSGVVVEVVRNKAGLCGVLPAEARAGRDRGRFLRTV